jgi:nitrogenase molybdenum-cofactor synthesis protein NifE
MSKLNFVLPPFSSDYAGACSCLFDLDCMVVIDDAACCSRNYIGYDEPRWFGNRKPIYCSALREMDAVLGNDEKLVDKIADALASIDRPEFVAILGSPVPAIIGADIKGIACEVESRTGIPSFGFHTTGMRYYGDGYRQVTRALLDRFATDERAERPRSVNLLGLTPINFSHNSNAADFVGLFEGAGIEVVCPFSYGYTLDNVRDAKNAELNVVMGSCGMDAARYMQKRWGIPYTTGVPFGEAGSKALAKEVAQLLEACEQGERIAGDEQIASGVQNAAAGERSSSGERNAAAGEREAAGHGKRILIVADQILGNTLRKQIESRNASAQVMVATFFEFDQELARPCDTALDSERQLFDVLGAGGIDALVGDPLVGRMLAPDSGVAFFALPHVAISSKLYWDEYPVFVSAWADEFVDEIAG